MLHQDGLSEVKLTGGLKVTGLILTIAVIALGIYDLVVVLCTGTGSSISQYLVNAGFKSPVLVFAFGFVAGHLFGNMNPIPEGDTHVSRRQ